MDAVPRVCEGRPSPRTGRTWRELRMRLLLTMTCVLVALIAPPAASAAMVSGTVEDPQGDADAPFDARPRDLQAFGVRYDAANGVLEAVIKYWDRHTPSSEDLRPWFELSADIGVRRD